MKLKTKLMPLVSIGCLAAGIVPSIVSCAKKDKKVSICTLTWDETTQGEFVYDETIKPLETETPYKHVEATQLYFEKIKENPKILANDIMHDLLCNRMFDRNECSSYQIIGCREMCRYKNFKVEINIYEINVEKFELTFDITATFEDDEYDWKDGYFHMEIDKTPFFMACGPFNVGFFTEPLDRNAWSLAPQPLHNSWYYNDFKKDIPAEFGFSPLLNISGFRSINNGYSIKVNRTYVGDASWRTIMGVWTQTQTLLINKENAMSLTIYDNPDPEAYATYRGAYERMSMFCDSPFFMNVPLDESEVFHR